MGPMGGDGLDGTLVVVVVVVVIVILGEGHFNGGKIFKIPPGNNPFFSCLVHMFMSSKPKIDTFNLDILLCLVCEWGFVNI